MILISAWSRSTPDGKQSPKNYPHWGKVVAFLVERGHEVLQVACKGEPPLPGAAREDDLSFARLGELLKICETWIAVDNFFPHLAWTEGEPGVAIFGSSDPLIFGHPENLNLLKDRRNLRKWQFRHWSQENYNPDIFVAPAIVIAAAAQSIACRKERKPRESPSSRAQ